MGGSGGGVKVVIINTQYVETDAVSFKSVVQKLTGKVDPTTVPAKPRRHCRSGNEAAAAPVMERVMSFKEFDMMLKKLPPLDELYALFTDN